MRWRSKNGGAEIGSNGPLGRLLIRGTGITTDVCVHSTIRTAIDAGYDGLLLEDCTAATVQSNYVAAISMIKQEGGYFGSVGSSQAFLGAIP
jgi:nicotinamidase-related amidase